APPRAGHDRVPRATREPRGLPRCDAAAGPLTAPNRRRALEPLPGRRRPGSLRRELPGRFLGRAPAPALRAADQAGRLDPGASARADRQWRATACAAPDLRLRRLTPVRTQVASIEEFRAAKRLQHR